LKSDPFGKKRKGPKTKSAQYDQTSKSGCEIDLEKNRNHRGEEVQTKRGKRKKRGKVRVVLLSPSGRST